MVRNLLTLRRIVSFSSLVAVVAVVGLYARHTHRHFATFTIDDAAISYAYAKNVATGHGFRLTPNTNPVEGFSNPLEVLLLVPCGRLGLDLDLAAKLLNIGAVVLAVLAAALLLWRNLRGWARLWIAVPCAFGFLWPAFNHWTAAGLEGGLLCGLQMLSVTLLAIPAERRGRDEVLAAVAVLLVLVRPEGLVYGLVAVLGRMLQPGRRWRCAGWFVAGCVAVFTVRFFLFRHWLPNTYYAKMSSQATFRTGWEYVRNFFAWYGLAYFSCGLPLFAMLFPRTRVPALTALAQAGFAVVFAIAVGGDWMRHYRFMQAMQGPYWVLCLIGLLALLSWRPKHDGAWLGAGRSNLVLLSLGPMAFFGLHGLPQRIHLATVDHDVDMRKIAKVGALYRGLGQQLDLGRPLLIADVDAGGMSYPPGIDVLDMGGLADLTFGYAWTRRPSEIVDYFFDYRRPHTMHTHGGWVDGRPMHSLSPFEREYRVMGRKMLDRLSVSWLTAIRADLVDPPMAPVEPMQARVGSIFVEGFSSLPTQDGDEILFVHALQAENADPRALTVNAADGRRFSVAWHAGQDVARGPIGSALVGMVRLPPDALPISLEATALTLPSWPRVTYEVNSAEALSRLPLYRLAGMPAHICHVDDFLAVYASAGARARGARLLGDLCGGGLSRWMRRSLAEDVSKDISKDISRQASASPAGRADDRYDALRVAESLGLPTSTLQLGKIERARQAHSPYDEVSAVWAQRLLRSPVPPPSLIGSGLAALVLAGQYDKALLTALFRGFTGVPEAREPLCRAMSALALRPSLLAKLRCPDTESGKLRVTRQGFESQADPTLQAGPSTRVWVLSAPPAPRLGGQGKAVLYLPPCTGVRCPEVVWGPLPWPGRRFGALVAGSKSGASIVVEAQQGSRWTEVARTDGPSNEAILTPVTAELQTVFPSEVRVRISNGSRNRSMVVDALTFLDL